LRDCRARWPIDRALSPLKTRRIGIHAGKRR
jgi:hypothetical protein